MKRKRFQEEAPSISAASIRSGSRDWSAVKMISVAKGSHCQATITMMDARGAWPRKVEGAHSHSLESFGEEARSSR
jgi:hypothetical protein